MLIFDLLVVFGLLEVITGSDCDFGAHMNKKNLKNRLPENPPFTLWQIIF